jgi:hypothetical protein
MMTESRARAAIDFLNFVPAMPAMQKEVFHTVETANRNWLARAQSEAKLISDFVGKLTTARSIPDGRRRAASSGQLLAAARPPQGVEIDDRNRPVLVIDRRAGQGPGIGCFKQMSEVGAPSFLRGSPSVIPRRLASRSRSATAKPAGTR